MYRLRHKYINQMIHAIMVILSLTLEALAFFVMIAWPNLDKMYYIFLFPVNYSTYDHRVWRTGLPVRSAVLKPHAGRLVVWWVTTCESLLLYVFFLLFGLHVCTRTQILR